jgi:hypothetical protein
MRANEQPQMNVEPQITCRFLQKTMPWNPSLSLWVDEDGKSQSDAALPTHQPPKHRSPTANRQPPTSSP